jgi:hypothetical protein
MVIGVRGGQIVKKNELSTITQHNIFSHLVSTSLVLIGWTHNAIGSLGDSLPSIESYLNLLEYDYIVVLPPIEFYELHVSKSKGVQRFLTKCFCLCTYYMSCL